MNREKQIEEAYVVNNEQIKEMADFLWKNTLIHTEDLCHDVSKTCYNAGHRKQSEVAREISRDIIEPIWDAYKNSSSEETVLLVALICEGINTQLKKKYVEESGDGR